MRQKFNRGDLVSINRNHKGDWCGNAIIDGSYAEVCHAHHHPPDIRHLRIYSVYPLSTDGKPHNHVSWFDEKELELITPRNMTAVEMVEGWLRYGY